MDNKILLLNYPDYENDFRLQIIKKNLEEYNSLEYCINPLWGNYQRRERYAKKPFLIILFLFKELVYLLQILFKLKKNNYKKIIIGYPAYFEAFFLCIFLSKKNKKKVYIDFLISIYDTIINDRGYEKSNSIKAKILFRIDRLLLKKWNNIIVDTQANAQRYKKLFGTNNTYTVIFAGSYAQVLNLNYPENKKTDNKIHVGWVGYITPLHGFDKILKCAEMLKEKDVLFHIIGTPPAQNMEAFIEQNRELKKAENIIFYGELNYGETMTILNRCDICLGIFGESEKAKSVIPFKIFDYLWLNKPIVTQYADAMKELQEFEQVFFVENNAKDIAKRILEVELNDTIRNRDTLINLLSKQYDNFSNYTSI